MGPVRYRYELRHGDEVVATGRLIHEASLEVGERIRIGNSEGIVRDVAPILGGDELRLVVQFLLGTLSCSRAVAVRRSLRFE